MFMHGFMFLDFVFQWKISKYIIEEEGVVTFYVCKEV
jgi:hypothetical protein